jgi:hypothetical protein
MDKFYRPAPAADPTTVKKYFSPEERMNNARAASSTARSAMVDTPASSPARAAAIRRARSTDDTTHAAVQNVIDNITDPTAKEDRR